MFEVKRKKNIIGIILSVLLVVLIGTMIYSGYKIIVWQKENSSTENTMKDILDKTEVIVEEDNKVKIDYSGILEENDELVGWIMVNNTNINYPVVKHSDNEYYLTHSFDKSNNSAGWIFMDYKNTGDLSDGNTIIYGHNRKDGSMFGSLKRAFNKEWRSNKENLIIHYNTLDNSYMFEIFSIYQISDTADYTSTVVTDELIKTFKRRSSYKFDVEVDSSDKILTLQTCNGSANKLVVHAKLIEEENEE